MSNGSDGLPPLKADRTFLDVSLYGSHRWCAARLGMTLDAFRKARPALEKQTGFPRIDVINGHTIKADVDEWVRRRRHLSDLVGEPAPTNSEGKINHDAA